MKQISVRLTDAEYNALSTEAARVKMSPTAYLAAVAREENSAYGMTYADLLISRQAAAAEIKRERYVEDDDL